jgi:glycerol-3-phosphate dehydrogenase
MQKSLKSNLTLTRQQRLNQLQANADTGENQYWDMIIIGGGITGAGIFKRACQSGLKALLIERKDFAWGSSSRSSKMVHGGLRYIAQGQIKLTQESVQERQKLLNCAPNLIEKQSFAMSHYQKQFPWPWIFNSLLSVYDAFGKANFWSGNKQHQYWQQASYQFLVPRANNDKAIGGTQFFDAMTDDARLVLRLIQEGQQLGGLAINYVQAQQFIYHQQPQETHPRIVGLQVKAQEHTQDFSLSAKVVVNATGAWAKQLLDKAKEVRVSPNKQGEIKLKQLVMRPLRGSHLIIASWRLPVASAVSVLHPKDQRPVQIFPWQKVTVVGTTDVEHSDNLNNEPYISQNELDYLLAAVQQQFPSANITEQDIISTFAGIRPVISEPSSNILPSKKVAPEKEKREHSIFQQPGLITATGGKLTTFALMAEQVLAKALIQLSLPNKRLPSSKSIFDLCLKDFLDNQSQGNSSLLTTEKRHHIQACFGALSQLFIEKNTTKNSEPDSFATISYSQHIWAELVWAVCYEQVIHLDDLLLRRTRLGNVLPNGALGFIEQIKKLCQPHLTWNEDKWQEEIKRYQQLWLKNYYLPTETLSNQGTSDSEK